MARIKNPPKSLACARCGKAQGVHPEMKVDVECLIREWRQLWKSNPKWDEADLRDLLKRAYAAGALAAANALF